MATVEEFAQLMWDRFINQTKAYTYMWAYDGKKGYKKPETPQCGNTPVCPNCNRYGKCVDVKDTPLEFNDLILHIQGEKTLAPYQLSDENTVKYLEFDVDSKIGEDGMEAARQTVLNLTEVIASIFGRSACMVEVSGSKGYHIWMFFSDQIGARFAYALGHFIRNSVVEIPNIEIEVFPKQITPTSYGAATRLPFGIHKGTGVRGLIVDRDFVPHDDQYETFKNVKPISEKRLFNIIEKYNIEVPESIRKDAGKGYVAYKCISRVMDEGLVEGERDNLMYRLGCYLRERGFNEDMALMIMETVNSKSQKPLHQRTVLSKLESAFKSDYSGMPCFRREFDSYCSSSCPLFTQKAKWRKTTVEKLREIVRD